MSKNTLECYLAKGIFFLRNADTLWDKIKIVLYSLLYLTKRYVFNKLNFKWDIAIHIGGFKIYLAPLTGELGTCYEIFLKQMYTANPEFVPRNGEVIFDIGANIGLYTLFIGRYLKNGKIFSFEPNPLAFKKLKKNIEENSIRNVFLFQSAVGGKVEKKILREYSTSTTISRITDSQTNNLKGHWVEVITLDSIIEKHKIPTINILKIDVEGYEDEVLRGVEKYFDRIQRIVVECHGEKKADLVEELLSKSGFKRILKYMNIFYFERTNKTEN